MNEKISGRDWRGPVRAVILDWAGTAVDHGCFGPVAVFLRAFGEFGLEPTVAETRQPMGREKKEHVAAMLAMPRIAALWAEKHGRRPVEADIEAVFGKVRELMPSTLAAYAEPVPGALEAVEALRKRGVKIGSCTGYSRPMMTELEAVAEKAGYRPDCVVAADEVPNGRPWPWMCWLNMMRLGVFPPRALVKAGDTVADIEEGLNAGCWSVGITRSSNALGLTAAEAAALDPQKLALMEGELAEKFRAAGAHYVISGIGDLPALCEEISAALTNGAKP